MAKSALPRSPSLCHTFRRLFPFGCALRPTPRHSPLAPMAKSWKSANENSVCLWLPLLLPLFSLRKISTFPGCSPFYLLRRRTPSTPVSGWNTLYEKFTTAPLHLELELELGAELVCWPTYIYITLFCCMGSKGRRGQRSLGEANLLV